MSDPCKKCEHNKTERFQITCDMGVPLECRTCARAALRAKRRLERLIVKANLHCPHIAIGGRAVTKCPGCSLTVAAARIAKRRQK